MIILKKKPVLDYVALLLQTNLNFVELIKEKCDSEHHGYIAEIARVEIESYPYNFKDLPYVRTIVSITSRSTHSGNSNHSILYCHRFETNNRWEGSLTHYEMPLWMAEDFVKFSVGLKDVY